MQQQTEEKILIFDMHILNQLIPKDPKLTPNSSLTHGDAYYKLSSMPLEQVDSFQCFGDIKIITKLASSLEEITASTKSKNELSVATVFHHQTLGILNADAVLALEGGGNLKKVAGWGLRGNVKEDGITRVRNEYPPEDITAFEKLLNVSFYSYNTSELLGFCKDYDKLVICIGLPMEYIIARSLILKPLADLKLLNKVEMYFVADRLADRDADYKYAMGFWTIPFFTSLIKSTPALIDHTMFSSLTLDIFASEKMQDVDTQIFYKKLSQYCAFFIQKDSRTKDRFALFISDIPKNIYYNPKKSDKGDWSISYTETPRGVFTANPFISCIFTYEELGITETYIDALAKDSSNVFNFAFLLLQTDLSENTDADFSTKKNLWNLIMEMKLETTPLRDMIEQKDRNSAISIPQGNPQTALEYLVYMSNEFRKRIDAIPNPAWRILRHNPRKGRN